MIHKDLLECIFSHIDTYGEFHTYSRMFDMQYIKFKNIIVVRKYASGMLFINNMKFEISDCDYSKLNVRHMPRIIRYKCNDISRIKHATNLITLSLHDVELKTLTQLNHLTQLKHLELHNISSLLTLKGIDQWHLESIFIIINEHNHNQDLSHFEILNTMTTLKSVSFHGILDIENLTYIENLDIEKLSLLRCNRLKSIDVIKNFKNLTSLSVQNCSSIKTFNDIFDVTTLTDLKVICNTRVKFNVKDFYKLCNLTALHIDDYRYNYDDDVKTLEFLSHNTKLKSLYIGNFNKITSLLGIEKLNLHKLVLLHMNVTSMKYICNDIKDLSIFDCDKLTTIVSLKSCKKLERLILSQCRKLRALSGIEKCEDLLYVDIKYCDELNNIDALFSLDLITVDVKYCPTVRMFDLDKLYDQI